MIIIPQFGLGLAAIGAALVFTGTAPTAGGGSLDRAVPEAGAMAEDDVAACAPRDQLVNQLGDEFRESQRAVGMLGDKAIMEIFVSGSGTWTILATDTTGTSCIIAAGQAWDEAAPILAGQDV